MVNIKIVRKQSLVQCTNFVNYNSETSFAYQDQSLGLYNSILCLRNSQMYHTVDKTMWDIQCITCYYDNKNILRNPHYTNRSKTEVQYKAKVSTRRRPRHENEEKLSYCFKRQNLKWLNKKLKRQNSCVQRSEDEFGKQSNPIFKPNIIIWARLSSLC